MRSIKRFEQRMEDWAPRWNEQGKLGKRSIRSTDILSKKNLNCLRERPQYNSNFMNEIGGRSNTTHPTAPTTIGISHFRFILFLFLALYRSYGRR